MGSREDTLREVEAVASWEKELCLMLRRAAILGHRLNDLGLKFGRLLCSLVFK